MITEAENYAPVAQAEQTLAQAEPQFDPRRWTALLALLLAAFMDLLDGSIVNVAIPQIQKDLGATYAAIQWVTAGYALSFAVLLITGGRLGDIFGRKRIFLIGVVGFTLASLLCGVAQSEMMLVAARFVQGAFSALMIPQILSIIQVTFPEGERVKAFGLYGAVVGVATVSGPLLGGLLVEGNLFGLEWRPIFLINLLVGSIALFAVMKQVRESKSPHAMRLDPIGVVLVTTGLLFLLYPLVQGRDLGWPAWAYVLMVASVPMLAAFALYERRKKRIDDSPLVELSLFKQRSFVVGLLIGMVFFAGIASFFLVFTLYLQIGLGFTPLAAGLTGLPFSVGSIITSALSSQLATRLGKKVLVIGMPLLVLGMATTLVTVNLAGIGLTGWDLAPAMFISGLGLGMVIAPLADVILAGIRGREAGAASGVLNTTFQVGGAVGLALVGVVFFGLLTARSSASIDAVVPQVSAGLKQIGVPASAQPLIIDGFRVCFSDRMAEKDPFVIPPSCQQGQSQLGLLSPEAGQQLGAVMTQAANDALKYNFTDAMRTALWFEIGVFGLAFLLVFFLPSRAPDAAPSVMAESPAVA
jgi:EmrB/QacA subfamily drug resistance transporter